MKLNKKLQPGQFATLLWIQGLTKEPYQKQIINTINNFMQIMLKILRAKYKF